MRPNIPQYCTVSSNGVLFALFGIRRAVEGTSAQMIGVVGSAYFARLLAGPLLINVADPAAHELFLIASILFSIALLPVALTRVGNPDLGEASRFGFREACSNLFARSARARRTIHHSPRTSAGIRRQVTYSLMKFTYEASTAGAFRRRERRRSSLPS